MMIRKFIIFLVTTILVGCSSSGGEFGPTIADLDDEATFKAIGKLGDFYFEPVETADNTDLEITRAQIKFDCKFPVLNHATVFHNQIKLANRAVAIMNR